MKKIIINILITLILINLLGCAAIGTTMARLENDRPSDIKVFPATFLDGELIYQGFSPNGIPIFVGYIDGWARVPFILGGTIDLPIAIASDTIFLPVDIYRWNLSAKSDAKINKQNQEEIKIDKQEKTEIKNIEGRCRDPRMLGSPTS